MNLIDFGLSLTQGNRTTHTTVDFPHLEARIYPGHSRPKLIRIERALEDSNPRHQVLETCVLPTELKAHGATWAD